MYFHSSLTVSFYTKNLQKYSFLPNIKNISLIHEGTEKVSLQLFKELNLHIACILFGYVQIFCTLMP